MLLRKSYQRNGRASSFLKWIVVDDIDFKKTEQQLQQLKEDEEKRLDEEKEKLCPKCLVVYIPKKQEFGHCVYHPAFVFSIEKNKTLTLNQAEQECILARLEGKDRPPPLIWICCGKEFAQAGQGCVKGLCGLPEELAKRTDIDWIQTDPVTVVQQSFLNNPLYQKKLHNIIANLEKKHKRR
ncbi:unnamed protein product [Didymodactylos carnosus]|uniref:Uncharacterized protein n=1 Tax=Didymodactylos carnosus TaxID=1234261 RepID=A0A815YRH0_9BILA|nr:unnamed protein product [Didymodactylos carnosus]CAF4438637.1 unnamed protein product [Didymodactylos carnosus]